MKRLLCVLSLPLLVAAALAVTPASRASAAQLINGCRTDGNTFDCEFQGSFTQILPAGSPCSFALEINGYTRTHITGNAETSFYLQSYHGEGTLTNLSNGASADYHQAQTDRVTPSYDPTTQILTITVVSSGELYVPIPGIQGGGKDTNNVGRTTTIYYVAFGSTPAPPTQYSADVLGDTANICAALS
jgi:hypothetical protein